MYLTNGRASPFCMALTSLFFQRINQMSTSLQPGFRKLCESWNLSEWHVLHTSGVSLVILSTEIYEDLIHNHQSHWHSLAWLKGNDEITLSRTLCNQGRVGETGSYVVMHPYKGFTVPNQWARVDCIPILHRFVQVWPDKMATELRRWNLLNFNLIWSKVLSLICTLL